MEFHYNGLQVTEEMKVTIAAVACLLLLNEREKYFPKLRSILIYPTAYFAKETTVNGNVVEEKRVIRLGESWNRDQLILSWEQVKQDTYNWHDGHNVVLHEFAHQLDQEDGKAEGVPILETLPAEFFAVATETFFEKPQKLQKKHGELYQLLQNYYQLNPVKWDIKDN